MLKPFLSGKEIKQTFRFAVPVIEEQCIDHSKIIVFASNQEDLETLNKALDDFLLEQDLPVSHKFVSIKKEPILDTELLATFCLSQSRNVFVCAGDIIQFDDDNVGLVNAVILLKSGKLAGKGNVFYRLRAKGGIGYYAALDRVIQPPAPTCVVTTGGSLHAKILHPTRPISERKTRQSNIVSNIFDCLMTAQEENIERLIFPFVYSGAGGVDIKDCARLYASAITEFIRLVPNRFTNPRDIYFVEIDKDKAMKLVLELKALLPIRLTQLMMFPSTDAALKGEDPNHGDCTFGNTFIKYTTGDIREANVDAIVCPEYRNSDFGGIVSNSIKFAFRINYADINGQLQTGNIGISRCFWHPERKREIIIMHAAAYTWNTREEEMNKRYFKQTMDAIFGKLRNSRKMKHIETIAIPLIGITDADDVVVGKKACKVFTDTLRVCCLERTKQSPLTIHLINPCPRITAWLNELLHLP
ncbi:uncharacterized protein LOC127871090 isoform X2 [Dreissena polymorpha]|nr:uncharacterized protein LOC127871090 isoform X2 [Dreissena polymorpha]